MAGHPNDRDRRAAPLRAAALGYDRGVHTAPRVLARGGGEVAAAIVARAEEHGIPIERDPDLLQCLAPLRVGDEIPVEAYQAVATILAFLYRKNGELGKSGKSGGSGGSGRIGGSGQGR